jgi:hypothetical protein
MNNTPELFIRMELCLIINIHFKEQRISVSTFDSRNNEQYEKYVNLEVFTISCYVVRPD